MILLERVKPKQGERGEALWSLWWMVYWSQPWCFHESSRQWERKGWSFCGFHIYVRCQESPPESTHSPSWAGESRELDKAGEPVPQLPLLQAVLWDSMAFCQNPNQWVMRQSRNQKNVQVIPDKNFVFWPCSPLVLAVASHKSDMSVGTIKTLPKVSKNNFVFVYHTITTLTQKKKKKN